MNLHIQKLAEQAGITFTDYGSGEFLAEDDISLPRLEKFAELIVLECIAQCEKNKDHEWLGSGSKLSAFNIKEHFGVEE